MKKHLLPLLAWLLLVATCLGSGGFNGTTAVLHTPNHLVGATPNYPVLILYWVKATDVTSSYYVGGVTDNAAIGALDGLLVISAGATASDPIQATSFAAGGASSANQNGMVAGQWRLCGALYRAANDRSAILGTTVGTANNVNRVATGLSTAAIGGAYYNGGATLTSPFNGDIAEVVYASGNSSLNTNIATILTQLTAGVRPIDIAELAPYINAYQPLRTGLNDSGYVGPDWTNVNVTFDASDHPFGLVRHWPLNDNAASTTVVATVGSNGTLNGGDNTDAKDGAGPGGLATGSLTLNGTDDSLSLGFESRATTLPWSIGVWFKTSSFAVDVPLVGRSDLLQSYIAAITTTNIRVRVGGGSARTFAVPAMSTGTWHFVLVTKDASDNLRLFLNGVESLSGTQLGGTDTWTPLFAGRHNTVFATASLSWIKQWNSDESANAATHYAEGVTSGGGKGLNYYYQFSQLDSLKTMYVYRRSQRTLHELLAEPCYTLSP